MHSLAPWWPQTTANDNLYSEGSFGVIFEGTNLLNNTQVAIKFEPRKSDAPQLRDEYRTYKILVGCRKLLPSPVKVT